MQHTTCPPTSCNVFMFPQLVVEDVITFSIFSCQALLVLIAQIFQETWASLSRLSCCSLLRLLGDAALESFRCFACFSLLLHIYPPVHDLAGSWRRWHWNHRRVWATLASALFIDVHLILLVFRSELQQQSHLPSPVYLSSGDGWRMLFCFLLSHVCCFYMLLQASFRSSS